MMPWWYYRGSVTTPVDIPGKGPTIITPRMRFQAPPSAVANLKRIGVVVECQPPREAVQTKVQKPVEVVVQPPKEAPVTKSDTKEIENAIIGDAPSLSAVVASEPSEPEAKVEVVGTDVTEEAEVEEKQEKEEESEKKSWRKRRR